MWFVVVGMKKGLTIARKVASRDVVSCCKDKARAYRSRERCSRDMWFLVVGKKKKELIDREKGGLEDSSWHVEHCTE